MKKRFIVTALFYAPEQSIYTKGLAINWLNRDEVRDFARQANAWLAKGVGYQVITVTEEMES